MTKIVLFAVLSVFLITSPVLSQSADPKVKEATTYFESFLKTWIVDQDIDKALTYFDKNSKFENELRNAFGIPSHIKFDLELWLRKTLIMWLYRDHAIMDSLGHGNPTDAMYYAAPLTPNQTSGKIQPKDVNDALQFRIEKHPESGDLFGWVGLKHAPRDGLIFQIQKVNSEWKIVFYIWMIG